ncbi:MAG: hypothetical protein KDA78_10325, partial [Planctomycetaceae bacterium]|nr:hypothetical protein [Planctomycetaceae bacterium]
MALELQQSIEHLKQTAESLARRVRTASADLQLGRVPADSGLVDQLEQYASEQNRIKSQLSSMMTKAGFTSDIISSAISANNYPALLHALDRLKASRVNLESIRHDLLRVTTNQQAT